MQFMLFLHCKNFLANFIQYPNLNNKVQFNRQTKVKSAFIDIKQKFKIQIYTRTKEPQSSSRPILSNSTMSSYNKKSAILQQLQHAIKRKINDKSKAKEQTSKILQASIEKRTQMTGNKPISRQNRVISSFKTKENKPVLNETPLSSIHHPVSLFTQQSTGMDVKLLGKKSQSRKWQKLLSLINYMLSSSDKAIKYISAANFEAEFAVKLFKSDKQNLINELKSMDLQQLANQIKGTHKSTHKDTVNRQLYNQLFDQNIKLKKEIVLLQKQAECFHTNTNLITRQLLLTQPANQNSSQLNISSLTHKLNSSSARAIQANDYQRFVRQLLQEKGFRKVQEVMMKEKKFQAMLGKCKEGDKKISQLHEILAALSHQKHSTFCSSLKQPILTQILKSKPSEVSQSSRSIIKIKQIHQEKQLLQSQIQNLKEQLQAVKNIDRIEKENTLLKRNHQLLYKGLNEILIKVDSNYLLIGDQEEDEEVNRSSAVNTTSDKSNIIIKIQEYISRKQAQSTKTHQHIQSLAQANTHLTHTITQLQQQRQSLHQSIQTHKHQTAQHLTQYKHQIERLNNAIHFLQTSESKTIATHEVIHHKRIAQLERNITEIENRLQVAQENEKYLMKRVQDLEGQLYDRQKVLQEKKQLIQENQQCQRRLTHKFQLQLRKQQNKYQQLQAQLSQTTTSLIALQHNLITTQTYSKGLQQQITQSTHKLNLYQHKITQLQQTIEDLQSRLQLSISDRQASQHSHIMMVHNLNQQMSDYRIQNLRLVDLVVGLERQLQEVRNVQNASSNQAIEDKNKAIERLEKDLRMFRQEHTQLINDKHHFMNELNTMIGHKQQINNQLLKMTEHLHHLQTHNNTLLNDNNNLLNDNNSLLNDNKILVNDNSILVNDNKTLFIDKQQAQNHLRNLQDHLKHLQVNWNKETQILVGEKQSLLNQIQGLTRCIDQVKEEKQSLLVERSSSEGEKDVMLREVSVKYQEERRNSSILKEENIKLITQLNALSEVRANSTHREEQLLRRIQVLEQELKLNFTKQAQSNKQKQSLVQSLSQINKQKQSLLQSLNQSQSQLYELQQTYNSQSQQIKQIVSQLQLSEGHLQQQNQRHQQALHQKQSQIQTLKQAVLNERQEFQSVIKSANGDIHRLNNQCHAMSKQLQASVQLRATLQQQLQGKMSQNQQLNREVSLLKQQLNRTVTFINQSSSNQSTITTSHQQQKQQQQQIHSLQHQLQSLNQTLSQLQHQNQTLTQLNSTLTHQLTTLQTTHNEQSTQLKQLEHEYKQLDEELATSMALFQEIKRSLQVEKHNAKMLNDLNQEMKLQHQGEVMDVQNKLQQERLKNMKLQRDVERIMEQANTVSNQQITTETVKLQHYEKQLSELHQANHTLDQQLSHLTQQLSSTKHLQLLLKQQLSSINHQKHSLSLQLTQKDTLINTLQTQATHVMQQLNLLSQQLSKSQMSNMQLQSQLLLSKQSFEELNRHIITVREELQETTEKNQSLQRKLAKANSQVQSLKHQLQSVKFQPAPLPIAQPQHPNPSIHQMKLQQYVVLLKKILQSTNIQFSDLKDQTSLDILLQKGCQRILKMKRQLRDQQSNRKKLNSQRGSYSYHDRLLVVNKEDIRIEAFYQEAPELQNQRYSNEKEKKGDQSQRQSLRHHQEEELPKTRLFEQSLSRGETEQPHTSNLEKQTDQTPKSQQKSSKSHHSQQQNISDFGQIEQNNMSKSQISQTDHQQMKYQQFINPTPTLENKSDLPIQPSLSQRKLKDESQRHNHQGIEGFEVQNNDIDYFNDVKSQKMNDSFVSQDGFNQPQNQEQTNYHQHQQIETAQPNEVIANNSAANKSTESQKLQDFDNFDDFKQSQSMNASMLSQKAEPHQQQHNLQQNNAIQTNQQTTPNQNPSRVLSQLDGFADYTSQHMSQSLVSQKQQKSLDDLQGFADYTSQHMSQSMVSQTQQKPMDDLDGFADYASQKMNESMISHKEEDFQDTQGNPFSDRKHQPQQQQEPQQLQGDVLENQLGDFDDYKSEKMNDSVLSEKDL